MLPAEAWFDLVIKRSADLRGAGILSIAFGDCSAVLAPADAIVEKDDGKPFVDEPDDPNPWLNGSSYPTGSVPGYGEIEAPDKMPEIPNFGDA